MRLIIEKQLQPQAAALLAGIKSMEQYQFAGYNQTQAILEAPSGDLPIELAMELGRLGVIVEGFEYWVEILNGSLGSDIPAGVSYATYLDEFEVEQDRTWAEIEAFAKVEMANSFGVTFEDIEKV